MGNPYDAKPLFVLSANSAQEIADVQTKNSIDISALVLTPGKWTLNDFISKYATLYTTIIQAKTKVAMYEQIKHQLTESTADAGAINSTEFHLKSIDDLHMCILNTYIERAKIKSEFNGLQLDGVDEVLSDITQGTGSTYTTELWFDNKRDKRT